MTHGHQFYECRLLCGMFVLRFAKVCSKQMRAMRATLQHQSATRGFITRRSTWKLGCGGAFFHQSTCGRFVTLAVPAKRLVCTDPVGGDNSWVSP